MLRKIRSLGYLFKINKEYLKGVFTMKFSKDSILVKNAILLLTAGVYKSIEEVPNLGNFREVVLEVLEGR